MDLIFPMVTEEQKLAAYAEATKLLNARIEKIMSQRAAAVDNTPIPTLTNLEKTHILFKPNITTDTIPMGKIYMNRIDNTKGDVPFPFGDLDN
jgi:hypothetical protein